MKILLIVLTLFLTGCGTKEVVKIEKVGIPNPLTEPIQITQREIKTNKDASIFMLDLYSGFDECNNRLGAIRELSNDN